MLSIPALLFERARSHPNAPAYFTKVNGSYTPTTYAAYASEVVAAAGALVGCGFARGDTVCMLGFNRPEWVVLDLAAMSLGGVAAGIYTTSSAEECAYILEHARAKVLWVENAAQESKIAKIRAQLPNLKLIVTSDPTGKQHDDAMTWATFLARGETCPEAVAVSACAAIHEQDIATLIYTSGTTGAPKAVALTHANLAWTAKLLGDAIHLSSEDATLSYLPLAHIAEQMASIHGPIAAGASVYFAESLETLPQDLKDARPTIFFAVPRVWEKFHAALSGKMALVRGPKARLLQWSRNVAANAYRRWNENRELPWLMQLQLTVARKLLLDKIKRALGLDRARILVSGAAPIAEPILRFFAELDLPICEIYGQSEGSGPTSLNLPGATRLGSVGKPLPGVEVRIAEDGEILVRGKNVFARYLHDEAGTREVLDEDGTLHSGDLGYLDEAGYLHITGRKKDIIITAGGKNITPKNIELAVAEHSFVHECVVIGDRRKYLVMLITLNTEDELCRLAAKDVDAATKVHAALQAQIDKVNATLARVEQIKAFRIVPRAFSQEHGELTPTMKLRRAAIAENHRELIESMFQIDAAHG